MDYTTNGSPTIFTYQDTGESYYYHPVTGHKVWLEDDQDIEDVIQGWEEHQADLADDAWSDRDD